MNSQFNLGHLVLLAAVIILIFFMVNRCTLTCNPREMEGLGPVKCPPFDPTENTGACGSQIAESCAGMEKNAPSLFKAMGFTSQAQCQKDPRMVPGACQPNNLRNVCTAFVPIAKSMGGDSGAATTVSDCMKDPNIYQNPISPHAYMCACTTTPDSNKYYDCYNTGS